MKAMIFILSFVVSTFLYSAMTNKKKPSTPKVDAKIKFGNKGEVSWELLRTLEVDPKTKLPAPGPELKKAIGKDVLVKGFMMPLDYDSKAVSEFLFMPYIPSCMHVPPPPPNQLILVKMKKGVSIAPSFYPVELKGKLSLDANKELESSFKIEGLSIKELRNEKQATFTKDM